MNLQTNDNIIVSAIIPVFNEEKYIKSCMESILNQDFIKCYDDNNFNTEIIFIDGNSTDNTKNILKQYQKENKFIKILDNSKKFISTSINLGIKEAKGKYIVRFDSHSLYDTSYISMCIKIYEETGAKNVGGPMLACGISRFQKIIAAAYNSPFALGWGKNHKENYEGYSDTVYLGFFEKKYVMDLGLYDENVGISEDDELNFRIIKNSDKVYISSKIKSIYYPRSDIKSLMKQYFRYGFYKICVLEKHNKMARINHIVPALFVLFIFSFPIILIFLKSLTIFVYFILFLYLILGFYFSFSSKKIEKIFDKFLLIFIHFIIHFSYGLGFILSIILKSPILFFSKKKTKIMF